METFILIVGLFTAAIGTLVLLLSLANKRAQLVQAYNIYKEIEQREQKTLDNQSDLEDSAKGIESIPTPVGTGTE